MPKANTLAGDNSELLQTAPDFCRTWRRQCKTEQDKYQLLCRTGGTLLQKIFKSEISFGLLGEFIQALVNCWREHDAEEVYNILWNLSKTNRFGLSLQFLSSTEKHLTSEIFKMLQQCISTKGETEGFTERSLSELEQVYGVK